MTHKYPAVLPPQRQEAIEEFVNRLRNDLIQTEVKSTEWERQAGQFKASADKLRAELDQAERRYQSAVHGRAKFREAFRKARAEGRAARKWMDEYAVWLMDELEGYQNDTARLALERRLGAAHAALDVGEEGR